MPEYPDTDSRHALTPDCRRCPELADARQCISWGNGSPDADVIVVGDLIHEEGCDAVAETVRGAKDAHAELEVRET